MAKQLPSITQTVYLFERLAEVNEKLLKNYNTRRAVKNWKRKKSKKKNVNNAPAKQSSYAAELLGTDCMVPGVRQATWGA